MSDYLNQTEEQQFEEAKKWFKQNGAPILMALTLALASWAGWSFWKKHQQENALKTSAYYQDVMESYLQDPTKNTPLIEKFIAENTNSNYALFALLEQAKQSVEKVDFTQAKVLLEVALAQSSDPTMQNIIRFRLASVELQLQQFDQALEVLSKVQDKAWELRKQVLVGDILSMKGDKVAAKSAYEQARANASESEIMLIDLRLNNL